MGNCNRCAICTRNVRIGDSSPRMNWKSFFDNWEEIFVGACLQFSLYFVISWWIIPIMLLCGFMWRLGGWEYGNKWFRWLGVPLIICSATFLVERSWWIFGAIPFIVFLAPAYGVDSWLYKWLKNDFLVRLICYLWYWSAFALFYAL